MNYPKILLNENVDLHFTLVTKSIAYIRLMMLQKAVPFSFLQLYDIYKLVPFSAQRTIK